MVTTEPGARARTVRAIAFLIVARIVVAIAAVGHVVVQLAGALDAYITAVLGVPRLAYSVRRFVEVMRKTWKADR